MSKSKVIKRLKSEYPELSDAQLNNIFQSILKTLEKNLKEGKTIEIRSFGTFFKKEIKEKKTARNPKTGELIYVPKKNKIRFRASKELKKLINKWKKYFLRVTHLVLIQLKK